MNDPVKNKMQVPLGVGQYSEGLSGKSLVDAATRLERLGYDSMWLPEINGREPFATCGYLLAKTDRLKVCSGIANVYVRDADAAAQGRRTLAEFADGRFSLGLGVSHPGLVTPRGHEWRSPVAKMSDYLDGVYNADLAGPEPESNAPVLVAAHGPKLLELAAQKADGAMMYMQTPGAVAAARDILGPDKTLHVTMRCVFFEERQRARDIARRALAFYIGLPAYHRAWKAAGFAEPDWTNGGSDQLIDAICPCGDITVIRSYMESLVEAGASNIILAPLHPQEAYDGVSAAPLLWDWNVLEALAD